MLDNICKGIEELQVECEYEGVIVGVVIEDKSQNLKVYVELDEFDCVLIKKFVIESNWKSYIAEFCENMNVIQEDGSINFNGLLFRDVKVYIVASDSGKLFIDYIKASKGDEDEIQED